MPDATCRRCPAKLLWARMPKGTRNPLDREPLEVPDGPLAGKGFVVYNPRTGGGQSITAANEDEARGWLAAGGTLHVSHFATCPERAQFRRKGRK